jgi:2-polyprenyl-3-methyl-5-hydroxy-6-metoxy-1,4-benzoquinol methylase
MHFKTTAPGTPTEAASARGIAEIYDSKPDSYYASARHDIVALMQTGPQSVVMELGCGDGGTGAAVLAAGKAGRYVGLELGEAAAALASKVLTEVLVGDAQALDLAAYEGRFDAFIASEVLEHLTDPWTTMDKIARCLKPGAEVFASSPNVAYWGIIKDLILGRFRYAEVGMMDRTHLRWYTPESFRQLFEGAGIRVESITPMRYPGWKGRLFNTLTGRRFEHLFWSQMLVVGHKVALTV